MGDNKWYVSDVKVNFKTKTDDVNSEKEYSGVKSYGFDKTSFPHEKTQTEDVSNITYTGYIIDNAGNENTCTIKFKRDATKPTCSLTKVKTYQTDGVDFSLKCSDEMSKVAKCDKSTTKTILAKNNKKSDVTYTVKDKAGNTNSCSGEVSSITDYRRSTRTWNSCKTGSSCAYYKYTCKCFDDHGIESTARPSGTGGCKSICTSSSPVFVSGEIVSSSCVNTCSGGWNAWGAWSDYSKSNYCNTDTCKSQSRTRYY